MGITGLLIAVMLFVLLPKREVSAQRSDWFGQAMRGLGTVFRNPQSIMCGMIAGLLFIPTTIFDMIWGVRYLQEAIGLDYGSAVMRSATVPFGWIIGCPLLGWISDRIGRRKPVILGGAAASVGLVLGTQIQGVQTQARSGLPPRKVVEAGHAAEGRERAQVDPGAAEASLGCSIGQQLHSGAEGFEFALDIHSSGLPVHPFDRRSQLVIGPRPAQVHIQPSGELGAIQPRLYVFHLYTRYVPKDARAEVFQVAGGQQKVVNLKRPIEVALAQPVGNHRPAEGARNQIGAAAQGGHQLGFEIGGVPAFGAQTQAMRTRHAGFVTVIAGEGEFARLGVDAVQHDASAIDLGVRGV